MFNQISGLPAHVLLIHVLVVFGPLGALFTVLSAVWPAARRKLGIVSPITCAIVLIATPIAQSAGHWLRNKLEQNGAIAAITKHANLGDSFLWYALALFAASVAVWWLGRLTDAAAKPAEQATVLDGASAPQPRNGGGLAMLIKPHADVSAHTPSLLVTRAVSVVAVVVSVVVVWQLYRIGDSGAHATWDYVHTLK